MRRMALGLTAALMTARAFWPSEPDLKEGAGSGLYWVFVGLYRVRAGADVVAGRRPLSLPLVVDRRHGRGADGPGRGRAHRTRSIAVRRSTWHGSGSPSA